MFVYTGTRENYRVMRLIEHLPAEARRVLILRNPTAGTGKRAAVLDRLVRRLRSDGWDVELLSTVDELPKRVGQIAVSELRAVVAAGGDGTVSAVVNLTPRDTPVCVFPTGTENLLAKYLEAAPDPEQLAETIARGTTVRLDAGQVGEEKLFLLMAGCGFDAEVVNRLHRTRRGNIGHWSYVKPILQSMRSYEYPRLRVYCEHGAGAAGSETPEMIEGRWVFVVNLPRYAGGLNFTPAAVGTDGLLDVCIFRHGSVLSGLRYLVAVASGRHLHRSDVVYRRVRSVRVETDAAAAYQLDGDPGGALPARFHCRPGRVRLVVSPGWAERHGFQPGAEPPADGDEVV